MALRAQKPDKSNFKKKNQFASFANAKFANGMFLPMWTMIDTPVNEVEPYEARVRPENFHSHSLESH